MTEMIERIARKLEPQAWAALGTGDTLAYANRRKSSLRKAQLAIEAMREPTPDMLNAGAYGSGEGSERVADEQTVREPGDEHPVLKHCDELHDLGFNAGWNGAIEEAAKLVRPKKPRPCDCERCYCGNHGDLEAVAAWDADKANADAILALTRPQRGGN